jgi:multicomponent K+:H+ antiporter subunit E
VTRLLPFPILSLCLLGMWLLLNQTLSPAHIVLGCIIATVGPWAMSSLEIPAGRVRRPGVMMRLAARVIVDIIRSNVAVARLILTPGRGARKSGFVTIPLELKNPKGLAVLSCIITSTPGTIWVNHSNNGPGGVLTIHVLDLIDEDVWIHTIKHRYERLLLEIFE